MPEEVYRVFGVMFFVWLVMIGIKIFDSLDRIAIALEKERKS